MVLPDTNSLTRIRFQFFNFPTEDSTDDFLFEPGFFFSELGFGRGGGVLVIRIGIGFGEIKEQVGEEEVFEGLSGGGRRRSVEVGGSELEARHEGLKEEVVEVRGGGVEGRTAAAVHCYWIERESSNGEVLVGVWGFGF